MTTPTTASGAPDPGRFADRLAEELEDLAAEAAPESLPPDRYLDREASWLDYSERILDLAADPDQPLLERVRFAAIWAGNLDEFFMVRVAGLQRRVATGISLSSTHGFSPKDQVDLISRRVHEQVDRHTKLFCDELAPALREAGIFLLRYDELSAEEVEQLDVMFEERVYPVLTPLAVDPAHPFPYISGLSLNLAVVLRDRDSDREHFARVKVPPLLPRFVEVGPSRFVPLEDVIAAHLPELFPGLDVLETHAFRVTRNEDVALEEDEVENLLQALERELQRRRFGPPVRLEVEDTISDRVLRLLLRELRIGEPELYRVRGPLDLGGLWPITDLDRPELKDPPFVPTTHVQLRSADSAQQVNDIFAAMQAGDVLVHHPYDSFATSVQALVEQAAVDPGVLAIKQTLYRTSGDSPIVDALIDAADAGKQVLVVVEIKARFDEHANIKWARALEQAGCHVVYGLVGLKTHAKLCLVVREEADGSLRRYAHVGTGNYNPKTARLYEDVGLLTADQEVGADIADLFNHLSGYTKQTDYKTLLVAPDSLRSGLVEMIQREVEHRRAGRPSGIWFKVNNLVDERVIDALYDASRAGVEVKLVIRGMCSLRPQVPGLSENISVRSIVGRFLEHSRIFRFANGGDVDVWMGSADLMHRNLDRRVEALVQLRDPAVRDQACSIIDLALDPAIRAWELRADGFWQHASNPATDEPVVNYQEELIRRHAPRGADRREPARGARSEAGHA